MKTKTFDCIDMMHAGQERIRLELAGLSRAEAPAYWEKRTAQFRA